MMIDKKDLYHWCSVQTEDLQNHPDRRVPLRLVQDSQDLGLVMATDLIHEIEMANQEKRQCRAIIPCGPKSWYEPFARLVNSKRVSLRHLVVFHMDECLDWEGRLLAEKDPFNFKTFMLKHFYGPVDDDLTVPEENRFFLTPATMDEMVRRIDESPVDITLGGWGQDGHVAYNQSRRHPFCQITLDQLRQSSVRIQENNLDTIIALGQRTFGAAYQFVPPMSITLGLRECLGAKKVRVYSDTGSWKQTALRVALFGRPDAEYPITLLQEHRDALITATLETARHPIAENPEWQFKGVNA